jgi:hypothetical protein
MPEYLPQLGKFFLFFCSEKHKIIKGNNKKEWAKTSFNASLSALARPHRTRPLALLEKLNF